MSRPAKPGFFICMLKLLILSLAFSPCFAAQRIVSFLPSNTEILFAIGASTVVGVSDFCDWPPQALSAEKVGDAFLPNVEKIAALRPDVVFLGEDGGLALRLKKLGIKTVEVPQAADIAGIARAIRLIGAQTGRNAQADALANRLLAEAAGLEKESEKLKNRPRVYIEVDSPRWTAGRGSFISDVLEKAGGINVFADISAAYARVSWETVVSRNPDVIISLSHAKVDYAKLPGADKINAIRNGRVLDSLDKNLISRPGPVQYIAVFASCVSLWNECNLAL